MIKGFRNNQEEAKNKTSRGRVDQIATGMPSKMMSQIMISWEKKIKQLLAKLYKKDEFWENLETNHR